MKLVEDVQMSKFNLSRRADIMFKLDFPEDVQGGLNIALTKLDWRDEASKIVVHIADAPGHGVVGAVLKN